MDETTTDGPPPGEIGGILFGRAGMLAMLGIAGVAAWFGFGIAVFLAGTLLTLGGLARAWSRAALARLTHVRRLKTLRAFPGDPVECIVELDNRKLLPLVWVNASERLPAAVAPDPATLPAGIVCAAGRLSVDTSLLWYQRASWRYSLLCRRRGYFPIGPATVASADVFGLFSRTREAAGIEHLIVYPRVYPLADLGLPTASPLGEVRARNPLFHDPVRIRGLRDYTPEVPFRHIHWKASARTGELQTKVFEPTSTLRVLVLLDTTAFTEIFDGAERRIDEAGFELAVSVAASLAWHFIEGRCQVGLYANTALAEGGPSGVVKAASGLGHLAAILETLARALPKTMPFSSLLNDMRPQLNAGTTLAVVTGGLNPRAAAILGDLHGRGFPVTVFAVGEAPMDDLALPCRRVRRPADLADVA